LSESVTSITRDVKTFLFFQNLNFVRTIQIGIYLNSFCWTIWLIGLYITVELDKIIHTTE